MLLRDTKCVVTRFIAHVRRTRRDYVEFGPNEPRTAAADSYRVVGAMRLSGSFRTLLTCRAALPFHT